MASEKQLNQREIYKKALQLAKKRYAEIPENKRSRKAWNKCMSESMQIVKTNKTFDRSIKEQRKPKNKGKHWLDWDWSD